MSCSHSNLVGFVSRYRYLDHAAPAQVRHCASKTRVIPLRQMREASRCHAEAVWELWLGFGTLALLTSWSISTLSLFDRRQGEFLRGQTSLLTVVRLPCEAILRSFTVQFATSTLVEDRDLESMDLMIEYGHRGLGCCQVNARLLQRLETSIASLFRTMPPSITIRLDDSAFPLRSRPCASSRPQRLPRRVCVLRLLLSCLV